MLNQKSSTGDRKSLYQDVASQADLPLAQRKAVVQGRNGKTVVPRCYHMKGEKLAAQQAAIALNGRFVSPFRRGGAYWGITESLSLLGVNERHLFKDVMTKMQEIMSADSTKDKSSKTAWEKFVGRQPKNPKNARDLVGKVLQNIEVLQRLGGNHPYAFKLAQLGACLNVYRKDESGKEGIYVELRTDVEGQPKPINERRDRRYNRATNEVTAGTIVRTETDDKVVEVVSAAETANA